MTSCSIKRAIYAAVSRFALVGPLVAIIKDGFHILVALAVRDGLVGALGAAKIATYEHTHRLWG